MPSTTAAISPWAAEEFRYVHLGDARLERRLLQIVTKRVNSPCSSLPRCHENWNDLKSTYRFMANDLVDPDKILDSHYRSCLDRLACEPVILAVQDSSQIDYSNLLSTTGLGPLRTAKQQGMMLHSVLAVRPDRLPLGLMHVALWARPTEDFGKSHQRRQRPFSEKESHKWVEALEASSQLHKELKDTLVVHIADREADIYDFIKRSLELEQSILVRSAHDRGLDNAVMDETAGRLHSFIGSQPVQGHMEVTVPSRSEQAGRVARLSLVFCEVQLLPPRYRRTRELASLKVWAVLAREESSTDQDAGDSAPIEWLLLSTLPVTTLQEAIRSVEWYTCRWTIEMFHKVLKSGCQIEKRRLGDALRLKRYLAIDLVVGWRVLYLTLAGRQTPDVSCSSIMTRAQWEALFCYVHKTRTPPPEPPTLGQAMIWIARLGGFLARKGDGHPGTETIWKGMVRLLDIEESWVRFGTQ